MFLLRSDWGARKPKTPLTPIRQVDTVFIHHSVSKVTKDSKADTRQIQNFHMDSRNYADIAYTLLVHPDGTVLEGRTVGGQAAQGAHTGGYNSKSVAICAIGNYEQDQVPDKLVAGINEALAYMVSKRWVIDNPKIRPHSDVGFTACCGKNLKARLGEIGVAPATPINKGVEIMKQLVFNATVTTDSNGNGYVDVLHSEGKDPVVAVAQLNGTNPSKDGYPTAGYPALWTAGYSGKKVVVTVTGAKPLSKFGVKVLMGW